ncbi:TonB-dependent receptor [Chitinophaga silvatica]|uniref:TonB-dependent receptor n=1 Tax=Chitinophaga silvatica TaxID=2282649 RepID=A0A3E1YC58_9BACT|nr:TonB-dependent receptor [Chitinophaga silvatica]RFS23917.1 TonB-dependent receptor [Chitinophaga silvatica]
MHTKIYLLLLSFTCLQINLRAQDSSRINQLNEITVTATKAPQKAGETGKVVTILTKQYLQQNSGKSIAEILNQQTGLIINGANNTRGTVPNIYTRGASNGNTLILIDGMPVSDASLSSNSFDLNFIIPEQVERIEILRGSQSTLYGSNAVAGVINIITKNAGDKKFGVGLNTSYGSYNDWQGNVSVQGNLQRFSYLAGYKYEKTRGFSDAYDTTHISNFDNDGFRQHSAFAKLGYKVSSRWQLNSLFLYNNYHNDLDEGAYTDERDYTGKSGYLQAGIKSDYQFKHGSWHFLYTYQRTRRTIRNDSTYNGPDIFAKFDSTVYTSNLHQFETYVNLDLTSNLRLIGGGTFGIANMERYDKLISNWDPNLYITGLSPDSAHINQTSLYASLLLHNLNGFNMELGGRYNYHNIYGNNQTFSFNPSYLLNEQHKFFINISSAYRIPSLYQLYDTYGNRNLKPETTMSYEAGYQASLIKNRVNVRATGFQRTTDNLILFAFDPVTFTSQFHNANKQKAKGFELEADWTIIKGLVLTANYTYVDGNIVETQNGKDTTYNNLYRIPKSAVNATLGYQATKSLYVSTTFKYMGERMDYVGWADKPIAPMGDYYTIDLYGEYKFGNLLKVYAGLRNITDYKYFDILGYNTKRFNFTTGLIVNL